MVIMVALSAFGSSSTPPALLACGYGLNERPLFSLFSLCSLWLTHEPKLCTCEESVAQFDPGGLLWRTFLASKELLARGNLVSRVLTVSNDGEANAISRMVAASCGNRRGTRTGLVPTALSLAGLLGPGDPVLRLPAAKRPPRVSAIWVLELG